MSNPNTRVVVRVCTPYLVTPTVCDEALNVDAPDAARLIQAHLKARDEATAAALPVKEGMKLTRFFIERLSRKALNYVLSSEDAAVRVQRAVAAGCHRYSGSKGERVATVTRCSSGYLESDEAWLDELFDLVGQIGIMEIGAAIIDLSTAGAAQLVPFGLPPGLKLAR